MEDLKAPTLLPADQCCWNEGPEMSSPHSCLPALDTICTLQAWDPITHRWLWTSEALKGLLGRLQLSVNSLPACALCQGAKCSRYLSGNTLPLSRFARRSVITTTKAQQADRIPPHLTVGQGQDRDASLLEWRHGQRAWHWDLTLPLRCPVVWGSTVLFWTQCPHL